MLNKKKYNVNGDPGIKAQVRAGSRYRKAVSRFKKSASFSLRTPASFLSPLAVPLNHLFLELAVHLPGWRRASAPGSCPACSRGRRSAEPHVACQGCYLGPGKPGWKRDVPHVDVGQPQKPFSLLAWDAGCLGLNRRWVESRCVCASAEQVGRLNPSCSFPRLRNLSSER